MGGWPDPSCPLLTPHRHLLPGGDRSPPHPSTAPLQHPHGPVPPPVSPAYPLHHAPPCPKPLTGAGHPPPPSPGAPHGPHPAPPTWPALPGAGRCGAQARVRYFGKEEPPAQNRVGQGAGLQEGGVGGGRIAPRDLTGPCPRGARRGHPSAPVNRKERQNAAKRWDSPAGVVVGGVPRQPRARPTRWSRTPGAPGQRRRCGTAGAGWSGRRTPAPGWSSAGAGR